MQYGCNAKALYNALNDYKKRTNTRLDEELVNPINTRMAGRTNLTLRGKRIHRLNLEKTFGPPDEPFYAPVTNQSQPRAYARESVIAICKQIYDLINPSNNAGVSGNTGGNPGPALRVSDLDFTQPRRGPSARSGQQTGVQSDRSPLSHMGNVSSRHPRATSPNEPSQPQITGGIPWGSGLAPPVIDLENEGESNKAIRPAFPRSKHPPRVKKSTAEKIAETQEAAAKRREVVPEPPILEVSD